MGKIKIIFFDIDGTLLRLRAKELSEKTVEALNRLKANGIWWDRAVDIIPANGGKGIGIQKVLEYYHLDKSEALAFGDGNNDIEMLLSVGTGVAMGNASPQLKEVADEICKDVAEDGIYDYCLTHGLI